MNHSNKVRSLYIAIYILIVVCMAMFYVQEYFRQKHPLSGIDCVSNYNIISKNTEASSYGEVHFLFGDSKYMHAFFLGTVVSNGNTFILVRDIILQYRILNDNATYAIDKMVGEKMHSDNTPDDVLKGFLFDKILGSKETLQFKKVNNIILVSDAGSPFFSCVIKQ